MRGQGNGYIVSSILYNENPGWLGNHTYDVFQDRRGLIWVLKGSGLSVFDGTNFIRVIDWNSKKGFRDIQICTEDSEGQLWVRILKGSSFEFMLVDTRTFIYKKYTAPNTTEGTLVDIVSDTFGSLWLLTQAGELWKQPVKGSRKKMGTGYSGYAFTRMPSRRPVISLHRYDTANKSFSLVQYTLTGEKPRSTQIPRGFFYLPIKEFSEGVVLNVDGEGLSYLNDKGEVKRLVLPASIVVDNYDALPLYELSSPAPGLIQAYIRIEGRLYLLVYQDEKLVQQFAVPVTDYFDPGALELLLDRESRLWSFGLEGLRSIQIRRNPFRRIDWVSPKTGKNYLEHSVRGIAEGLDGSLYFSSSNTILRLRPGAVNPETIASSMPITAVLADSRDGLVWFKGLKLMQYNPATGKTQFFSYPDWNAAKMNAWSLLDRGQELWVGDLGLTIFDKEKQSVSCLQGYNRLGDTEIYQIFPYEKDTYFLLGSTGLFVFHRKKGVQAVYGQEGKGKYFLPASSFRHLHRDKKGRYWLATASGLIRWNPRTGEQELLDEKLGLRRLEMYAVYSDAEGNLWLSTENGIQCYNPDSRALHVFLEKDGVTHREGNRIAHYQAKDGTLYFGTVNGITAFQPGEVLANHVTKAPLSLFLTGAYITSQHNQSRYNALPEYYQTGRIELNHSHPSLTLRFAREGLRSLESGNYFYRIKGKESDWITLNKPEISLVSLPYGHSVIEIQFGTGIRRVSDGALAINVFVRRPFYLRWWFFLLAALSLALGVLAYIRYRVFSLNRRKEELEEEVHKRTQTIEEDRQLIRTQAMELVAKKKEKDLFFANITHEFRTPLTLVTGPIQSVLQWEKVSPREAELLEMSLRNARQLEYLVEDMLLLSVMDAGFLTVQPGWMVLSDFVADFARPFALKAASEGIEWQVEQQDTSDQKIRTDSKLLRIILTNLVSNALKFTERGGRVSLRVSLYSGFLEAEVTDTGRGIHPDDLPHIFERFFQTRRENAPAEGGTGIGLASSKELATLLGGSLDVKSVWGSGSVFLLRIPLIETDSATPQEGVVGEENKDVENAYIEGQSSKKGLLRKSAEHILIVDDNPDMRKYLTLLLQDYANIVEAANGKEAWTLLEKGLRPVLIISDLMMPEMDGLQLLARLRGSADFPEIIPFIMLTARSGQTEKQSSMRLGVDDYILKPFSAHVLQHSVLELIRRQETRRHEHLAEPATPLIDDIQTRQSELEWLAQLEATTMQMMGKDTFSIDQLAAQMLLGRTSFYQEVKRLTGLTPNQYVLEARMIKARNLLETNPTISFKSILQQIGLRDERYFVRLFQQRFGQHPSHFKR